MRVYLYWWLTAYVTAKDMALATIANLVQPAARFAIEYAETNYTDMTMEARMTFMQHEP